MFGFYKLVKTYFNIILCVIYLIYTLIKNSTFIYSIMMSYKQVWNRFIITYAKILTSKTIITVRYL